MWVEYAQTDFDPKFGHLVLNPSDGVEPRKQML